MTLAAAILAAAVLVACGDSGSGTSSSVNSTGTAATPPTSKQSGTETSSNSPGDGGSQTSNGSGGSAQGFETAPLKVSGGGSAQFRVKGGDNSIQNFGEEGDESELEEAAAALHAFLVARAVEDWPTACSKLSKTVTRQLEQLASQSGKLSGTGCARILASLTPPLPPEVQKESTIVDAGSLRTEGDQSFLIYRGAEGTTYAMLMAQEDGAWKVAALAATPLS